MNDTTDKKFYEKKLLVPIEKSMWLSLRKISFDNEISMSKLTRDAIAQVINKYEKGVDLTL